MTRPCCGYSGQMKCTCLDEVKKAYFIHVMQLARPVWCRKIIQDSPTKIILIFSSSHYVIACSTENHICLCVHIHIYINNSEANKSNMNTNFSQLLQAVILIVFVVVVYQVGTLVEVEAQIFLLFQMHFSASCFSHHHLLV